MGENYKPNSHAYKNGQVSAPAEKKVEKVVSGKVKTKKNEVRKITDIFIAEDVSNIKNYVFMDVLVPAFKKAVSDIVKDSIDMLFYGETRRSSNGSGARRSGSYVSYSSISDPRDSGSYRSRERAVRGFDYDDILFESRGQADLVLEHMNNIIDEYGEVSVADLYDLCDLTAPYTANNYGWRRLGNAEIQRVRDGYIIRLPRAVSLK